MKLSILIAAVVSVAYAQDKYPFRYVDPDDSSKLFDPAPTYQSPPKPLATDQVPVVKKTPRVSRVQLKTSSGGTMFIPSVKLSGPWGSTSVEMMLDSGSGSVKITDEIYKKVGGYTVGDSRMILADGSTAKSMTILIKSVKVGDIEMHNVTGTVGPGPMLLGQSFLKMLRSWAVNNQGGLVMEEIPE
jgi:clan AA aspartic protease (TIGR02281 family)